jgi:hypothetical protein
MELASQLGRHHGHGLCGLINDPVSSSSCVWSSGSKFDELEHILKEAVIT